MQHLKMCKTSWRESIDALSKDLKILLLVSGKSFIQAYHSLLSLWYIPISLLVGLVFSIPLLLCSWYTVLFARAARPSIDMKDSTYWQKCIVVEWIIFLLMMVLLGICEYFSQCVVQSWWHTVLGYLYKSLLAACFLYTGMWMPDTLSLGTMIFFLSPLIILITLFMLDAEHTLWAYGKACARGIVMYAYNYPFFVCVYIWLRLVLAAGYLASVPLESYISQCSIIGWFLFLFVAFPYWICFITSFYVKRLHEQFALYYAW
jgi:hypothetical protein